MKANTTNTTTKTTVGTPSVSSSSVTAAAAAAMLDHIDDLAGMAATAVQNNMTQDDFVRYVSMSYFNTASDLEALKRIQNDAVGAFKKALAEKALADDMTAYQNFTGTDRMLIQITEAMTDFGDSSMANLIQTLLLEKASKVKIAFELGKHVNDKKMMQDIEYIIRAMKLESSSSGGSWTAKLVEVYGELFDKK